MGSLTVSLPSLLNGDDGSTCLTVLGKVASGRHVARVQPGLRARKHPGRSRGQRRGRDTSCAGCLDTGTLAAGGREKRIWDLESTRVGVGGGERPSPGSEHCQREPAWGWGSPLGPGGARAASLEVGLVRGATGQDPLEICAGPVAAPHQRRRAIAASGPRQAVA